MLLVQGTKLGAVGALAALLGTAQALGWVHLEPHRASEMGIPTLMGSGTMAAFALAGLAIAPPTLRPTLKLLALRWLAGSVTLAAWGAWLLTQSA